MIFPQHTSHEFFYRSCDFHFNILCSFEVIAKTLSVALEVSLSIVVIWGIVIKVLSTLPI